MKLLLVPPPPLAAVTSVFRDYIAVHSFKDERGGKLLKGGETATQTT